DGGDAAVANGRGVGHVVAGRLRAGGLGGFGDAAHDIHCGERGVGGGGLGREADGGGGVAGGGGGRACVRPRRRGGGGQGLEHLGRDDDGLAGLATAGGEALLKQGDLPDVHFHAEIAAGDHDAVGERDQFFDVLDCLDFFNFHDRAGVAAVCVEDAAEFAQVA